MELKRKAFAGSLESNDLTVTLIPGKKGREISIQSIVSQQFYQAIKSQVIQVLDEYCLENVIVEINDMGALDFVLRSRMETAIQRAEECSC